MQINLLLPFACGSLLLNWLAWPIVPLADLTYKHPIIDTPQIIDTKEFIFRVP